MNNTGMPEIANRTEQVGSLSRHFAAEGAGATLLEEYEARLAVARERFDQHPAVKALFRDPIDPTALEAFLISFAIVGVRMTEPVEGWIRRAGAGAANWDWNLWQKPSRPMRIRRLTTIS